MSKMKLLCGVSILLALQGCNVVRQELRHSGGYPGYQLDRRVFDSGGSKKIQLLRLTMILALASRVGNASVRDGEEADAYLHYLRNATNEVNYLAAHLYGQEADPAGTAAPALTALHTCSDLSVPIPLESEHGTAASDATCGAYTALFESDLPQLEYKIVRLVIAALPREQAGAFARAARTGNVAAAAWNFLRLAAASADGLHRGAAVHRSNTEIGNVVLGSANCARRPEERLPVGPVEMATACLGHSLNDLFDRPLALTWPREADIHQEAFLALFAIIRTSCALLPLQAPTDGSGKNPVTERREVCSSFQFRPRLRPGTILP